jgi:hypothetical protein
MKLSNATTRTACAAALYVLCTPLVSAATDNATLTVGHTALPSPPLECTYVLDGYMSGMMGSYSPTGLTGGWTVTGVSDSGCYVTTGSSLSITGFPVSPGQLWLTSVTCNGVTRQALAATYSYSSGRATWGWSGTFGFSALSGGSTVSCSITHN